MGYSFMSNINIDNDFNSPENYYQQVGVYINSSDETPENGVIIFNDEGVQRKAKFLMIRAGNNHDFVIQLFPSRYCVYIPAGELWSVDSIEEIDKLYIKNIFTTEFDLSTQKDIIVSTSTGQLQWMIGYK